MNVPSKTLGNWSWRLQRGQLNEDLAARLARLVELTDRDEVLLEAEQRKAEQEKKEQAEQPDSVDEQRKRKLCEEIST